MTAPATRNITIPAGDDYAHRVTLSDVVLTGRTYRAHLRRLGAATDSAAAATFTIDASQDGDDVVLVLELASATTATLSGSYRWQLEQTLGGERSTILAGYATVTADVTFTV